MQVAPARNITGPAFTGPYRYGLFSTAPIESLALHEDGGLEWEVVACDPVTGHAATCATHQASPTTKSFTRHSGLTEAAPFTVYGTYICSPIGRSEEEANAFALSHLTRHEQAAVEKTVADGTLGNTPTLQEAATLNLTPASSNQNDGTAVSIRRALGILEAHLAFTYGGPGVIHMPREVFPVLPEGLYETIGDQAVTSLGNVISAGNYPNEAPDGTAAASGEAWIYATPPVLIRRSATPHMVTSLQTLDRDQNDLYALAERTYVVGWDDCPIAAVKVTL